MNCSTESKQLLRLHDKFQELMFEEGIPLLSFAEGEKTQLPLNVKILMVPPESSGKRDIGSIIQREQSSKNL